jgi:DNA-binding MarR family transcriptional regulator
MSGIMLQEKIFDIHQKEKNRKEVLEALMRVNQYLINEINDCLRDFDITRQQYNVLCIINEQSNNEVHINLIKDHLIDKMSDASRIVNRLVSKQLVTKFVAPDDKRRITVQMTAEGERLFAKLNVCEKKFTSLSNRLDDWEVQQLEDLLKKWLGEN